MNHAEDGFYTDQDDAASATGGGPSKAPKVLKKIPQKVIQNAVGLAIFTTMRTGLWVSGAGGSGVLVARREDGRWSPPSGIMLHTAGLGFLVGVDIYDCVLVINNRKALEAFTKIRATVGGEISAVAGPVGVGGVLENDGKWKQANRPVFTYLKSRGFYAGVQVDGTVVIERTDENARFYGERIGVTDILAGRARHPPPEIKMLMETLRAAEGDTDVDGAMMDELDGQLAPGDLTLEGDGGGGGRGFFGVPQPDDPDPYGVHALEKEGLAILEAGTRQRPSSLQFEYNPSPTSPTFKAFHRRGGSTDTTITAAAATRRHTMSPRYVTSATQTDDGSNSSSNAVTRQRSRSDAHAGGHGPAPHQDGGITEADKFYDVGDVEGDSFVNEYVVGNPWKSSSSAADEAGSVDSGVAIEQERMARPRENGRETAALDGHGRETASGPRSLVPPPLPMR